MVYIFKAKVEKAFSFKESFYLKVSYYGDKYHRYEKEFHFNTIDKVTKEFVEKFMGYFKIQDIGKLVENKITFICVQNGVIFGFKHPTEDKFLVAISGFNEFNELSSKELEEFIPCAINKWEIKLRQMRY